MPGQLGGAPTCPVCNDRVYFNDQKCYMSRTWHKKCFKCGQCSKVLESSTANLTSDDGIYCNNCFRKLFSGSLGNAPKREEYVNTDDADCCPRCGKRVFFAEQMLSLGRKWHKTCFTCAACNKKIDSTTSRDHDGELFCRACHSRNFGPKGYGFAGGAGTMLSMDTGRPHEVTRENVPHTAEAYSAPDGADVDSYDGQNGNGTSRVKPRWGGGDYCPRCEKQVFIAEKRQAAGNCYHEKCFTCYICNKKLDSSKLTEKDGEAFCNDDFLSLGPSEAYKNLVVLKRLKPQLWQRKTSAQRVEFLNYIHVEDFSERIMLIV